MELKGSRTEGNLLMAFAGKSQARNRYTFFFSQARNDGFIQIATIFEETANQEKEHAKRFFKFLQGGEVKIECAFPAGIVGTTTENLLAAADGEHEESTILYPASPPSRGKRVSRRSPSPRKDFRGQETARTALPGPAGEPPNGRVFKRGQPVKWRCLNCGYVHEGPDAPAACPACAHPQAYFELLAENW